MKRLSQRLQARPQTPPALVKGVDCFQILLKVDIVALGKAVEVSVGPGFCVGNSLPELA